MQSHAPATKTIHAKCLAGKMYDWANSAFSTTIVGALYGPYLTEITQRAVGENGSGRRSRPAGRHHCQVVLSHLRFRRSVSANLPAADSWKHCRLLKSEKEDDGVVLLYRRRGDLSDVFRRRQISTGWAAFCSSLRISVLARRSCSTTAFSMK